jgi:hypothetical protein
MKNLLLLALFLCSNLIFAQTSTPPAVGDGSPVTPYQIATIDNLYWLSQTPAMWTKYFVQTADIDAIGDSLWDSGQGFTPIGNTTNYFTGNYNGQGHIISHLFINRAINFVALFGFASGSNISNLGVISVNINATHYAGGLIGGNMGTVSNCYSTGILKCYQYSGGLISTNTGTVNSCYSTCNYIGSFATFGGLIGDNSGLVTNCYSRGNVTVSTASDNAGFASWNLSGTISNCYSTGSINGSTTNGFGGQSSYGTVSANFFDQTTSLQASGYGATAKTTLQMKSYATFTAAGWDVNVWNIDPAVNDGYPYLKWQNPSGTPLPVELFSFTANVFGRTVKLNWESKTEINTNKFIVERKSSLSAWEPVASVNSSGQSNSSKQYSYIDNNLQSDNYQFRLIMIDNNGSFLYSKTIETTVSLPDNFGLSQNYPNPFNPSTKISYSLPSDSKVSLEVYNITGAKIAQLINEVQPAGYHSVDFNSSSISKNISTGVYFYCITASSIVNKTNFSSVKKMILLK